MRFEWGIVCQNPIRRSDWAWYFLCENLDIWNPGWISIGKFSKYFSTLRSPISETPWPIEPILGHPEPNSLLYMSAKIRFDCSISSTSYTTDNAYLCLGRTKIKKEKEQDSTLLHPCKSQGLDCYLTPNGPLGSIFGIFEHFEILKNFGIFGFSEFFEFFEFLEFLEFLNFWQFWNSWNLWNFWNFWIFLIFLIFWIFGIFAIFAIFGIFEFLGNWVWRLRGYGLGM